MKTEKTETVETPAKPPMALIGILALAGFILGCVVGYVAKAPASDSLSVQEAGFEVLSSPAVTAVSANVQGAVREAQGRSIIVEKDGQRMTLDLPEGMESVPLTIISLATDDEIAQWDTYQNELTAYYKAVEVYNANPPSTGDGSSYPVPPVAPFQLQQSGMPDDSGQMTSTKAVTQQVALADLKAGDQLQASLYASEGMTADPATGTTSSTKELIVNSVYITRDTTQTVSE